MIHVTLRRDQVECVIEALEYIAARFDGHMVYTDQPAGKLACRLAKQRAREVCEIFEKALKDGPAAV